MELHAILGSLATVLPHSSSEASFSFNVSASGCQKSGQRLKFLSKAENSSVRRHIPAIFPNERRFKFQTTIFSTVAPPPSLPLLRLCLPTSLQVADHSIFFRSPFGVSSSVTGGCTGEKTRRAAVRCFIPLLTF